MSENARLRNTLTERGWIVVCSFLVLTGLCVAGAAGLLALHLGGLK